MEMEKYNHIAPPSPEEIPVIDLSNPNKDLVARAVVKASEEWGIFHVVNHGIPQELIQRLKEVGTEFHELPETAKKAVAKPEDSTDIEGYTTNFKGWADHLFHRIWPPERINYSFWPKNSPDYREVNEEYAKHIKKLSEKIMEWLSEGLGLRREAFKEGLGGEKVEYLMKLIFYPPCPDPGLNNGAPAHTDFNGVTFLIANEVHGLQAFKDDNWIDVKYDDSMILVIIADQFHRMSNGKYKSAEHRATMDTKKTRISWPVFVEPNLDQVVGPLPELFSGDDTAPKFKPYAYSDFKFHVRYGLPLD
ncbi:unnamed protein product [Eruca vesicaria subsp. sativa]|uniref:Fe2OG dioxygenase domain-containing protein n=1 Tax=Eruca vesicaria subsp. sativa TaxID=29727 RepID=A0ABC8K3C3_ERUVS|nr:unnamed protein product [Eruca vesicaria subsp. sativa]